MFGNHGLGGLLEEGAHEKSPKCLGGNLGDFGEFCKGLMLTDDQAQEVFQSIMRGRDVGYSMLMEAVFDSGIPDNDCFVLVPVPQIAGYDDIAYLLKDVEYGPSDHIEFLEQVVSEKTAAWLFERNEETVLQWMEENGLNWGNFTDLNTSRPESKGKVIHKAIKSWAIDTVRRYLNSHPLQNS
ncbi:fimbrial protein MS11-D1 precursor [Neisseria meningitidis]|nr:hypothetical protein COH93_11445 [Neisseria meningitidis]CWO84220.1 fimbrial protein MS11-D1 precursor [Neisseria meningitidis]CWT02245.1 fimbrial protein MS11-D1 precursor [Neisseria meningitidis]